MKEDSLGNRMKENYEDRYRFKLIRRLPVIIRLDGKAFHTLTKQCDKPFDKDLSMIMIDGMKYLLDNIQGAKLGYQQSDEISILITDFDTLTTDAWFDYNIQKICSVSASMISSHINGGLKEYINSTGKFNNKSWLFDSRCFNIPKEEVNNYFIWRQKDWERNSLQMLCRAHFTHKELCGKNKSSMHEMLYNININWGDLEPKWKNGVTVFRKADGKFLENNDNIFLDSKICDHIM